MTAHAIFWLIIALMVGNYVLDQFLETINLKSHKKGIPDELKDLYSEGEQERSVAYHTEKRRLGFISSTVNLIITVAFFYVHGFAWLHEWVSQFTTHYIWQPLGYFGVLALATSFINLPFGYHNTFVIEQKYGFNKTSMGTFWGDIFKSTIIGAIIGGAILAAFIWFYAKTGPLFWVYAWSMFTGVMLLATMFYTSLILPVFNKLTPLEDGDLKMMIENYCAKVEFKLDNVYVIDGSKRSSKANAFFSGLGPRKKIVLYDTLLEQHTNEELVAVLAHEVGHYKLKHTLGSLVLSVLQVGLMLFLLSLFLNLDVVSEAMGLKERVFHVGLVAFALLYTPISMITGMAMKALSRKNEFAADKYATETYNGNYLADALKKLSVENLSNLNPSKLYVFFHYSHPPLKDRLKSIADNIENS